MKVLLSIVLLLSTMPAWAAKACREHGGVASCDPSGQVVCKDGQLDKAFTCVAARKNRKPYRKPKIKKLTLKMKDPTQRGQILKPGETPPSDTLEESYRELNR